MTENRRDHFLHTRLLLALIGVAFIGAGILPELISVKGQNRNSTRPSEWVINRPYRLTVTVDPGPGRRVQAPVSAEVNFADLLKAQGNRGRLDRDSIRIVGFDPDTGHALPYQEGSPSFEVPHQLSHEFFYQDAGKIWWRLKDEQQKNFHIYFDVLENGRKPAPDTIALIGNGDNFLFNNREPARVDVSMSAIVRYLDWDADGKKDLILGSSQTHEYGVPWNRGYIYFYKNIGTPSAPLFAPGYQLKNEGGDFVTGVEGHYMFFDIVDWDNDGDSDFVVSRGNNEPGKATPLNIIENSGKRDRDGLPVLKMPRKILDLTTTNDFSKSESFPRLFRLLDWDGDGDVDILFSVYLQKMEPNCYVANPDALKGGTTGEDNRSKVCYWDEVLELFQVYENTGRNAKGEPNYAPPRIVKTARGIPLSRFGYGGADYLDWDQDGDWDLITSDMQNDPQGACRIFFHENFGTRSQPQFLLEVPVVSRAEDFGIDPNPYVTDWDADGDQDLLLAGFEGWVKIYENTSPDPKGVPQISQDGRFVLQTHPKITDGEQTRTAVADWNGDGLLDLIRGGGNGWVNFYENIGTKSDPVFSAAVRLTAAGEEIRFINGLRDCPQGPSEPNSGYTTPVVIDFDGDADLDLIVGDMRAYQTYFENVGTRSQPKLDSGRTIQMGAEPRSFGFRNQVAVGDLDGDGKMEIATTSFTDRHLAAYKLDAQQSDSKLVKVTRVDLVRLEDGSQLLPPHSGGNNSGDNMAKLEDWDNDGDLDLLFSSVYYNYYYENIGNRTKPIFKAHGRIQVGGKDLVVTGHANTIDAVDWNGDGKKDLLISGESGWLYYFDRSFIEGNLPKSVIGTLEVRK